MKRIKFIELIFAAVIISSAVFCVNAQSGSLDTSFGSGGIVTGSLAPGGIELNKVVIQQLPPYFEPKLVVATRADNSPAGTGSDFYVLRYNSNGSIDGTFGNGGVSRISMTPDPELEYPRGLAIQADGKIVVAGWALVKSGKSSIFGFAVTRLNPDGALDTSFGNGGRLLFNFTNNQDAFANAVAIQSDGRILVAGRTGAGEFAVARLLPTNGAFDTSFNGSGKSSIKIGNGQSGGAYTVKIQPNGGIVLGGSRAGAGGYEDFAVVRLNPNGSLDNSFGGTGIVSTDFFNLMDRISDLAFDADGNIVAVGIAQAADYSTRQFAVTRYLPNGQLNQNFNGNGKLVYGSPGFNYNTLGGVAIDSLGRITAAGYREITSQTIRHFAVLRLNPNGTFDNTFGGTGIVFTSITDKDRGTSIVIQPDGRMVVAGSGNSSRLIVLARYLP